MGKHQVKARYKEKIKAFGARIKELREEKGLTQEELADLAGVSENTINTIEQGTLNTTIATVFAIAEALGEHQSELLKF